MRYLWSLLVLCGLCYGQLQAQTTGFYGEKISDAGAKNLSDLPKMIGQETELGNITLRGTIVEVCKKKGCWMTLDMGNNQTMLVKFKDYGFFVPKTDDGKEVVIQGVAKRELVPVERLQHYAEDAGKSLEEIAAITEPEEKFTFEAVGVIIYNSNGME
ncbi:DUF4920 domain-containing protein [Eisenibacter elegans]|jgi:hypothetical protein|uniref:DUF4920 domain-containing protein n=1 Tax=Eisenibacter elegans TaxID=997 RepID=UPI000406705C|nr:DUF4920 domain-containing protein [Eisenibacter elegans]